MVSVIHHTSEHNVMATKCHGLTDLANVSGGLTVDVRIPNTQLANSDPRDGQT